MPTRRIFEIVIVATILMHPVLGMLRMWAQKTLADPGSGTFTKGASEIVTVVS